MCKAMNKKIIAGILSFIMAIVCLNLPMEHSIAVTDSAASYGSYFYNYSEVKKGSTCSVVNGSLPSNYNVEYRSLNTDVATVDSTGKVTGLSIGEATIIATVNGDINNEVTILIYVYMPTSSFRMIDGKSRFLTAVDAPFEANGDPLKFYWFGNGNNSTNKVGNYHQIWIIHHVMRGLYTIRCQYYPTLLLALNNGNIELQSDTNYSTTTSSHLWRITQNANGKYTISGSSGSNIMCCTSSASSEGVVLEYKAPTSFTGGTREWTLEDYGEGHVAQGIILYKEPSKYWTSNGKQTTEPFRFSVMSYSFVNPNITVTSNTPSILTVSKDANNNVYVTGVKRGRGSFTVRSASNSSLSMTVEFSVSDTNKVTLVGISTPSISNTTSYFTSVKSKSYDVGSASVSTYSTSCTPVQCKEYMKNSDIFIICGEGQKSPNFSYIQLNANRTENLLSSDMNSLSSNYFAKTKLALFAASHSGYRYLDSNDNEIENSLVDVVVAKGAKNAVGFKYQISNEYINSWITKFYNHYHLNPNVTLSQAASDAIQGYEMTYPTMRTNLLLMIENE